MPEFAKWVNGHKYDGALLSPEQIELRHFYKRLLHLCALPAFAHGEFLPLNPANISNPEFGRLDGDCASGHWLYAFLRHDPRSRETFLVTANLHPNRTLERIKMELPPETWAFLDTHPQSAMQANDELNVPPLPALQIPKIGDGIQILSIPPLSAAYWRLQKSGSPD
jgi:hypothetical protein